MLTPLPRNKRAKNPKGDVSIEQLEKAELEDQRKLDAEVEREEGPESKEENPRPPVKKVGKQSAFGAPLLDEINLEISPKSRI